MSVSSLSMMTPRSQTFVTGATSSPETRIGSVDSNLQRQLNDPTQINPVLVGFSRSPLLLTHSDSIQSEILDWRMEDSEWYLYDREPGGHTHKRERSSPSPDQLDDTQRVEVERERAEYGTLWNTKEDNRGSRYSSVVANELSSTLEMRSDPVEGRSPMLKLKRSRCICSIPWSTVSNAALRSRKLNSVTLRSSAAAYASVRTFRTVVSEAYRIDREELSQRASPVCCCPTGQPYGLNCTAEERIL